MRLFSALFLAVTMFAVQPSFAASDADHAAVEDFYQLLSGQNPGDVSADAAETVVTDWESIPTPRGGDGVEGLVATLAKIHDQIPDFTITPQAILRDGNTFTVRSIATGTPTGTFFGVETSGKSFEIMTIDIHEVEDGQIVRSWHIEEWHSAIRQIQ